MEVGERLIQQEKQRVVAGFDFGDVADVDASTFSGAASFVFVNVGAKSFFRLPWYAVPTRELFAFGFSLGSGAQQCVHFGAGDAEACSDLVLGNLQCFHLSNRSSEALLSFSLCTHKLLT